MQGFSGKILPEGLEIFAENRRLDLAISSNPGITFAPRTEMTDWCGSLKDVKMEVNRDGGRFEKKSPKICMRRKRDLSESVERQIPHKGCMSVSERLNTFRWEGTGILPGLPSVGDGLVHLWNGRSYTVPAFRKMEQLKKVHWNLRKSTSWHEHKRNGPHVISLNKV